MSLRFFADAGPWPGVILAVILAAAAFALYRREVRAHDGAGAWVLPALRALVVWLVVMMLTQPVLHHQLRVGELARLLVVMDCSQSMGASDLDLEPARKLLIAERLHWLPEGTINQDPLHAAEQLQVAIALAQGKPTDLRAATTAFHEAVVAAAKHLDRLTEPTASVRPDQRGRILREGWANVPGFDVEDLTKAPGFPNQPTSLSFCFSFAGPANWGERYGARLRGYVYPPVTGNYVFWINADDKGELWLSKDDQEAGKQRIALVPQWTPPGVWDRYPEQRSAPLPLAAGKRYYIEALHKQQSGGDNLAVGWTLPDGTLEQPIPGSRLAPPELSSAYQQRLSAGGLRERFRLDLLEPARALAKQDEEPTRMAADLVALGDQAVRWEKELQELFLRRGQELADSPNDRIRSALATFAATTRWQRLQKLLLGGGDPVLARLARQHEVELLGLTENHYEPLWQSRAGRLDQAGGLPVNLGTSPTGTFTSLDRMPAQAVKPGPAKDDPNAPRPKTALVLISDGQHNHGESPLQLAKILGHRGIKVFALGVGSQNEPQDLALARLEAPDTVFFKDRLKGKLFLKDNMFPGKPFTIRIECEGQVLWEQRLTTQQAAVRPVDFDFSIEQFVADRQRTRELDVTRASIPLNLRVVVPPPPDDREPKNNELPMRVHAILQKRKLLLIEERPRWEWRYLKNTFERDEQWQLNALLADRLRQDDGLRRGQAPPAEPGFLRGPENGQFPADREALFAYDLIILGDVPRSVFRQQELQWLAEFVGERGGGLALIDGQRGQLRRYADTALGPLLPVTWTPDVAGVRNVTQLRLTTRGESLAAFQLASGELPNAAVWADLLPPHWAAAVHGVQGTETLLEGVTAEALVPLVSFRHFGAGRVYYAAFDESWRWRYKVGNELQSRYWHQVAHWMTEAPYAASNRRVAVDAGAATYLPGEAVELRARLREENGKPITKGQVEAVLTRDGAAVATVPLLPDENESGVFRARTAALDPGEYQVRLKTTLVPESALTAETSFLIQSVATGELAALSCNEGLLRQMTASAGGAYVREERVDDLVEQLAPLSHGTIVEKETILWQSYWWFVPIILLLTLEWAWRKWRGLL